MYKHKSELQLVRLTNSYLHEVTCSSPVKSYTSWKLHWIKNLNFWHAGNLQDRAKFLFIRMKCCSILYQSCVGNMKKFYVLENSTGSSLDQKWDFLRALFSKTWHVLIFPTHNQQRIGQHFMQMNKKLALYPTDFLHARNSNFYLM